MADVAGSPPRRSRRPASAAFPPQLDGHLLRECVIGNSFSLSRPLPTPKLRLGRRRAGQAIDGDLPNHGYERSSIRRGHHPAGIVTGLLGFGGNAIEQAAQIVWLSRAATPASRVCITIFRSVTTSRSTNSPRNVKRPTPSMTQSRYPRCVRRSATASTPSATMPGRAKARDSRRKSSSVGPALLVHFLLGKSGPP